MGTKICPDRNCNSKGLSQPIDNFYPRKLKSGKIARESICRVCRCAKNARQKQKRDSGIKTKRPVGGNNTWKTIGDTPRMTLKELENYKPFQRCV